jgi:uncharacterized RDD family membrane protein YckC
MNNDNPLNQVPGSNPFQQQPSVNPYAAPMTDRQPSMGYEPSYSYGMEQDYVLASLGSRFLGSLIDGMIVVLVAIPFVFMFASDFMEDPSEETILLAIMIPVLLVSCVQWYLIATSGQSIAKKMLGMKIVKLDGSDPGFLHGVILRVWVIAAAGAIPFLGNFVGLADALAIFGEERRCLHDRIAGTRVISV